ERVDFLARGRGYTVFLTPTEAVLALRNGQRGMMNDESKTPPASSSPGTVLRMQLVGANLNPQVTGGEELPGRSIISAAMVRRNGARTSRRTLESNTITCTLVWT